MSRKFRPLIERFDWMRPRQRFAARIVMLVAFFVPSFVVMLLLGGKAIMPIAAPAAFIGTVIVQEMAIRLAIRTGQIADFRSPAPVESLHDSGGDGVDS
jgi:hypothetical protein